MKFVISRQELSDIVSRVQNIVAPKTPMPILSNILIEAFDSQIVVTATDLTVAVRASISAKISQPGAVTVPARRFAQLLRELSSSQVEVSANERNLVQIVAGSSKFRFHGLPKNEFPALPDLHGATRIQIQEKVLRDALFRTSFAVSREDSRYVLTGVYCQVQQNGALFVGTDGKRLARTRIDIAIDNTTQQEAIIPIKAVEEMSKNLEESEEQATLILFSDKIVFEARDILIVSKLLVGDYPDVERVIPLEPQSIVSVHREELMSLLRQMILFTSEQSHSVRLSFTQGELSLSANTQDIGDGRVSMPVQYTGERFDIAFNPSYFLDVLRHCKEEIISFGYTDAFNPGLIIDGEKQSVKDGLPSPLFVLMPMRLSEE